MDQASPRPAFLAREDDPPAVGRKGHLLRTAERLRRRVGVHALGHIDRVPAGDRPHKQMRPAAVLPRVPVTHEQRLVDPPGGLALLPLVEPVLGVLHRLGVGEDLHRVGDVLAVGTDQKVAHVQRLLRHLLGLAAIDGDLPDLGRSRAARHEPDGPAIGTPARVRIGFRARRELSQPRAVRRDEPQMRPSAVGVEIGPAHGKDDELAVRRDLRVRDPVHGQHVANRERMRRAGRLGHDSIHNAKNANRIDKCRQNGATHESIL